MKYIYLILTTLCCMPLCGQNLTINYYTDNVVRKADVAAHAARQKEVAQTPLTRQSALAQMQKQKPPIKPKAIKTKKIKQGKQQEAQLSKAWVLFDKKDYAGALQLFKQSYSKKPAAKTAQGIAYSYYNLGQLRAVYDFILPLDFDVDFKRSVYEQQGWADYQAKNFTAAQQAARDLLKLNSQDIKAQELLALCTQALNPPAPNAQANAPKTLKNSFGVYNTLNILNGDGLGHTVNLTTQAKLGLGNFSISYYAIRLTSGASGNPQSGSYYLGLQSGQLDKYPQKVYFFTQAMIGYNTDKAGLNLGLSPIGGVVSPTVVGNAYIRLGRLLINGQSMPVTETTLSYNGIKDVYTGTNFGRVNKSGLAAIYKYDYKEYFFDASLGGYYLWGSNVKSNSVGEAGLSVGRSTRLSDNLSFAGGVFAAGKMYAYDLNHFTYGHGGYFSPQKFIAAGPFGALNYAFAKDSLFKLEMALPFIFSQTKNSDKYYAASNSGLSGAAQADYDSKYQGFSERKIGFNILVSITQDFGDNWQLYGALGSNASADYNEHRANLNLIKFF